MRTEPVAVMCLLGLVLAAFAQEPFQRDKVMVTRGRNPYVPLDNPTFIRADRATFLTDEDQVLGVDVAGERRAYPVRMMAWHHVVNDSIGSARRPIAIVY